MSSQVSTPSLGLVDVLPWTSYSLPQVPHLQNGTHNIHLTGRLQRVN